MTDVQNTQVISRGYSVFFDCNIDPTQALQIPHETDYQVKFFCRIPRGVAVAAIEIFSKKISNSRRYLGSIRPSVKILQQTTSILQGLSE